MVRFYVDEYFYYSTAKANGMVKIKSGEIKSY
jgi:hypothetical protein